MSTLPDRDKSALLVIDVQNGVAEGAFHRDEVITNIARVVDRARSTGIPVVWVQHSDEEMPIDSAEWQIVNELAPRDGEPRVRKEFRSSFEATNLETVLGDLGAGRLIVCGMQTNNCIRHTAHAALERGYDVTLISDAHTTTGYEWNGHEVSAEMLVDETNDNFTSYSLPGRSATVTPTASAV
jgi:nicotinamidase-related amidase